jgi:hypothetical protein
MGKMSDDVSEGPYTAAGLIYQAMEGDANRIMDEMEEYPDVEILQDWKQGTTTYRFGDGSALIVDGPTVMEHIKW